MSRKWKKAEVTDAEAARRALDVAGQLMGTNPARVERAERRHDRMREALTGVLEMLPDAQKQEMLVRAALEGNDAVVEQLLAAGVDVDATASFQLEELDLSFDRETALVACVCAGQVRTLELLLDAGADVSKAHADGFTALLGAVSHDRACLEPLLRAGANTDAQDRNGETALIQAAGSGRKDIVEKLLAFGADRALIDHRGMTALQHAEEGGHSKIVSLLQE